MRLLDTPDPAAVRRLLSSTRRRVRDAEAVAARIVRDVRRRGDVAVGRWSQRLDGDLGPFEVTARDLRDGWDATPRDVRSAIRQAARHLRRVAERQRPRPFAVEVTPGVRVEQRVRPYRRVGCYVPAGRYPLPSTMLMTTVPARVAGVKDVVAVCPRPAPAVLAAALEGGATRMFRVGGAQAVAALAYGTDTVPAVDKIVGPGNAWVAAAKRLVSADCAIDMDAGPSEIVVWSTTGRPDWIAADLIAQAEHDPDARAMFVTTRRFLAQQVVETVQLQLPRRGPARQALSRHGAVIVVPSRRAAVELIDAIAPEHLVVDKQRDAEAAGAAGTVFVGRWSVQAAGDYTTGSNHVLPTGGAARTRGGLSAADFVRVFSVQTVTRRGLGTIGPAACALAAAEGLPAHAASIQRRLA